MALKVHSNTASAAAVAASLRERESIRDRDRETERDSGLEQYGYVFNSTDNKALAAKPPTPTVQNVSSKMENGKWQQPRLRQAAGAAAATATSDSEK